MSKILYDREIDKYPIWMSVIIGINNIYEFTNNKIPITKSFIYRKVGLTIHHSYYTLKFLEKNGLISVKKENKYKIIKITEKGKIVAEKLNQVKDLVN